jgi:hypothetical protein
MTNKTDQPENDDVIYTIVDGKKVRIEIPVEGALGLLAMGAVGLKAWRKVRAEAHKQNDDQTDDHINDDDE